MKGIITVLLLLLMLSSGPALILAQDAPAAPANGQPQEKLPPPDAMGRANYDPARYIKPHEYACDYVDAEANCSCKTLECRKTREEWKSRGYKLK